MFAPLLDDDDVRRDFHRVLPRVCEFQIVTCFCSDNSVRSDGIWLQEPSLCVATMHAGTVPLVTF